MSYVFYTHQYRQPLTNTYTALLVTEIISVQFSVAQKVPNNCGSRFWRTVDIRRRKKKKISKPKNFWMEKIFGWIRFRLIPAKSESFLVSISSTCFLDFSHLQPMARVSVLWSLWQESELSQIFFTMFVIKLSALLILANLVSSWSFSYISFKSDCTIGPIAHYRWSIIELVLSLRLFFASGSLLT